MGGGHNQYPGGLTCSQSRVKKRATLQIVPCTVSQLLLATEDMDDFVIGDTQVNQVSLVGIIRRTISSVSNILYTLDDMTGPPMDVKQWMDSEDPNIKNAVPPGTYVKVFGSLRSFEGQRSLVAVSVRGLGDLNEITFHMLEVVQAHMLMSGSSYGRNGDGVYSAADEKLGLTSNQSQVLEVVKSFPDHNGICFTDLRVRLGSLGISVIRKSLQLLLSEGHIFSTIDEEHFKAIANSS